MSNQNRLPAWSIRHLEEKLQEDLMACNTKLERDCCKAIGGKHIRETAIEWARMQKLSPCEVAIAKKYGYKGS